MLARCLLLLTALPLTSCDDLACIDYLCQNGFTWLAPLPPPWTTEEVEAGHLRLCLNGACEERPFGLWSAGRIVRETDASVSASVSVHWQIAPGRPLADGDLVSLTLLTADGTTIMGIAEAPVTYDTDGSRVCDYGTCRYVSFEGSTL